MCIRDRVGKACKVLPFLEDTDKEYIAKMVLGKKTISDDIWEEVLEETAITPISDFQSVLDTFKGEIKQLPPKMCIRDRGSNNKRYPA